MSTAERENSIFTIPYYRELGTPITEERYAQFLRLWGNFSSQIGQMYPLSHFSRPIEESVILAVTHITTTISYMCQAHKTLRATRASGVAAFAYRFNITPSCPWMVMDEKPYPTEEDRDLVGPAHTAELPFVFADMDRLPMGMGTCTASAEDRAVSRKMVSAWTGMAGGRPGWPEWEVCEAKGAYFGEGEVKELDFGDCEFWDGVWKAWGGFVVPRPDC